MLSIHVIRGTSTVHVRLVGPCNQMHIWGLKKGDLQELAQILDQATEDVADALDWIEDFEDGEH